ncbi:hypothetical protein [Saccharothrix sp.]|nr:hypothetical protein [Saccharothrix sp.]
MPDQDDRSVFGDPADDIGDVRDVVGQAEPGECDGAAARATGSCGAW